eukprot:7377100-Prymnesium_polylepis.2
MRTVVLKVGRTSLTFVCRVYVCRCRCRCRASCLESTVRVFTVGVGRRRSITAFTTVATQHAAAEQHRAPSRRPALCFPAPGWWLPFPAWPGGLATDSASGHSRLRRAAGSIHGARGAGPQDAGGFRYVSRS